MNRYPLCILLTVALLAAARADDQEPTPQPAGDSYASLSAEFLRARQTLANDFRTAKTEEDRARILEQYSEAPRQFANRFLQFAHDHADDPTAFDALVWVVTNSNDGDAGEKAIAVIVAKHLDDPKITPLCQQLSRSTSPAAKNFLETVIKSSQNVEAQAYATYGLAKAIVGNTGERNDKAEALLKRVVKNYAEVANGTLAKTAERDLYELQHLLIGCDALEITGEDIDGVEFSLSDYRGKIVVLDFWGHW